MFSINARRLLVVAVSIFPVLAVAFYLLKWAFDASLDSPITWESVFRARLELLAQLLIPLAIAVGVVWIFSQRKRVKMGVRLGIIITLLAYVILCAVSGYQTAECLRSSPQFVCGEWGYVIYAIWIGMFIVNILALLGLSYWFNQRNNVRP